MIAVDTLVHNFLHRTGILWDCGIPHNSGAACYAPGGCAEAVRTVAGRIDARAFNPKFPARFPRFVQHAIWRLCAADSLNLCNGNRTDDRKPCQIPYCYLHRFRARSWWPDARLTAQSSRKPIPRRTASVETFGWRLEGPTRSRRTPFGACPYWTEFKRMQYSFRYEGCSSQSDAVVTDFPEPLGHNQL
jgi:hypothetical protein